MYGICEYFYSHRNLVFSQPNPLLMKVVTKQFEEQIRLATPSYTGHHLHHTVVLAGNKPFEMIIPFNFHGSQDIFAACCNFTL